MTTAPIMIMAGGTGGHIFPGLAVAEVLRARNQSVVWLGTERGLEAKLVPDRGIEIEWIDIVGVRRRGLVAWLAAPFKIARAIWQALGVVRRRRPAAVLGVGGFVSGPGGIAAWLTRKPLVIHEQNAVAGSANRMLARFADRVFEAFPGSFAAHHRAVTIGNPIRREIVAAAEQLAEPAATGRRPRVLVIGGSQGALALNEAVPRALALMPEAERPEVRHQAGRTLAEAQAAYRAAGVEDATIEFIADMAAAYRWADLVIARAGAISLAESYVNHGTRRPVEVFDRHRTRVYVSETRNTPA
ncbi:MAG: undecaprenyldiphospho-muramoylpentapeptide beta-N-acetylglucosaminyltransferase [Gammaproteobacteria bacterium]|nr:undecaprenyldiphospho-muramoylpentapeptide beta-N-acetylglucosaminyltransferase [Gammaproteobacteria bacterium]